MAEKELLKLQKIGGIVLMVAGVIFMLLTFLDNLQDGKTDGAVVVMNALFIVFGVILYVSGRKSERLDE